MTITPFDDSPKPYQKLFVSGGMDTSAIDQFRQGIELTGDIERLSRVFFRLSSGNPKNELHDVNFGQFSTFCLPAQASFQDNDKFNPLTLIETNQLTYPLSVSDNSYLTDSTLDGCLDVFNIRNRVLGLDTDFPVYFRDIKSEFSNGNIDSCGRCNVVEQADFINSVTVKNVDFFLESNQFFNFSVDSITPFNDVKVNFIERGIKTSVNMGSDMLAVLYNLNPTTDDFDTQDKVSMRAGFIYDGLNQQGTDSLAFGGFFYK